MRPPRFIALAVVAFAVGCGEAEDRRPAAGGRAEPQVRTAASKVARGASATLLRFPGVGRFVAGCRRRPSVAFAVALRTAQAVGVDQRGKASRVRTLDPGERLRTSLEATDMQRWHVASSHSDGARVLTASVAVAPVVGGGGACLFSVQATRSGRIP
jgi:hypothetical protein